MSVLLPGFGDPVLDAQSTFRALLEAMARPGRAQRLARLPVPPAPLGAAAGAVMLALADAETPVWTDGGEDVADWLRFHAGSPVVPDAGAAAFALAVGAPPPFPALHAGTDDDPHTSATLILQVGALEEGAGWRLSGPGIESEHRLRVDGAPDGFVAAWAANAATFPRGVDVILCAGDRLAGLPRTTRIQEG